MNSIFQKWLQDFQDQSDSGYVDVEDMYLAFKERMENETLPANIYLEPVISDAKVPEKKTDHAACYDVFVSLTDRTIRYFRGSNEKQSILCRGSQYLIYPGERVLIPTGWKMCCDPGWKIEVAPRSGNAFNLGITLINAIGVLDADYRDEAMLLVINHSNQVIKVNEGERFAQLSLEKVNDVNLIVGKLPPTNSNRNGGIGHTGSK